MGPVLRKRVLLLRVILFLTGWILIRRVLLLRLILFLFGWPHKHGLVTMVDILATMVDILSY